ncbi:amidohydrolase [Actinomadura sp. NBRC 104412]|uniref:amidohydrolase n=1 Tax=Actinomadura sp. NBRC 104412 TaxID=3032203 RepID=UPI0024A29950|nr:amidohydrolase family protein [Actinomadura sp. NBRC 104412]GLZ02704.1 amidohydrolase [Actinomadura sp. NBRC 104412]
MSLTRRGMLGSGAAAIAGVGAAAVPAHAAGGHGGHDRPPSGRDEPGDLALVNGRILTQDRRGTIASDVLIRDGMFAEVGRGLRARAKGMRVIDLRGRTVVPGIIDNHNHIVLMGLRPGFHTPLENAYSIGEALATLKARATRVPAGRFVTTIGGFHSNQFAERRLPTLAEIDAVLPGRPVYLQIGFNGPSVTNGAGRAFFESRGVTVGPDGSIAAGQPSQDALFELRRGQTLAEQKRGTLEAMAYAVSLGVTTHFDQGGFPSTGTSADGAAHFDRYRAYDAFLALRREGRLSIRLRINFLHLESDPELPELTARLNNAFPEFGDDLMKVVGIGEFTAAGLGEVWLDAGHRVARAGWINQVHSLTRDDFQTEIAGWETINATYPIKDLRWTIAHVPFITEEWIRRLKALGGGLSLTGWRYLAGTAGNAGPPFRTILDSGIHAGMSSDGMQIAPMNPWLHMYYATTGRNARGELINDGQQITRDEVLRLYTAENGWFTREEDLTGSIEPGRFGDLAVLSHDYRKVPDEGLKRIRSVLTVVGGRVVHDALPHR